MSYIILNKTTGQAVAEIYDTRKLAYLNTQKYRAMPAYAYLCQLNRQIKAKSQLKERN